MVSGFHHCSINGNTKTKPCTLIQKDEIGYHFSQGPLKLILKKMRMGITNTSFVSENEFEMKPKPLFSTE